MSIPAVLPYGYVSVYGVPTNTGNTGMRASGFVFGAIDQIAPHGIVHAEVGQSVMFKSTDKTCQLTYLNIPYQILEEAKITLTENPS